MAAAEVERWRHRWRAATADEDWWWEVPVMVPVVASSKFVLHFAETFFLWFICLCPKFLFQTPDCSRGFLCFFPAPFSLSSPAFSVFLVAFLAKASLSFRWPKPLCLPSLIFTLFFPSRQPPLFFPASSQPSRSLPLFSFFIRPTLPSILPALRP